MSRHAAYVLCLLTACAKPSSHVGHDHDHASGRASAPQTDDEPNFEVWLIDQSNSPGKAFGGTLHVFAGSDLMGSAPENATPIGVVDLGAAASDLCVALTGAPPVRPHMLFFNKTNTHAIVAFVASGHVLFLDAATHAPVGCVRTSIGSTGLRQAHAAIPSEDESFVLVANQNGKRLERIDTNYATNTFTANAASTLDLATCVTPNGALCQDPALRPDNAPICPIIESGSQLAFVTLRGGGLFVVDATTAPMSIRAEYDGAHVGMNGCGGIETSESVYIDSGGGTATHLHGFHLYRFPTTGYDTANPPNLPAPEVIFADNHTFGRDAHGMATTKHDRYLWVLDRGLKKVEIIEADTGDHVGTVVLITGDGDTPTPDLADRSPAGNRVFFSMRGPNPLSGDPHVATGSIPGLGVLQVTGGGKSGALKAILPISNPDANGVERADPHAIRVRHLPVP